MLACPHCDQKTISPWGLVSAHRKAPVRCPECDNFCYVYRQPFEFALRAGVYAFALGVALSFLVEAWWPIALIPVVFVVHGLAAASFGPRTKLHSPEVPG